MLIVLAFWWLNGALPILCLAWCYRQRIEGRSFPYWTWEDLSHAAVYGWYGLPLTMIFIIMAHLERQRVNSAAMLYKLLPAPRFRRWYFTQRDPG